MTDAFDNADYYACRDPDCLSLSSPEEALEEQLDGWVTAGPGAEAEIRSHCPLVVMAFQPRKIPDSIIKILSEDALERIDEHLGEEFGDPDGGSLFPKAIRAECIALLMPVIRAICDKASVWLCEEVGRRSFSADEVVALMREHCPELFDAPR